MFTKSSETGTLSIISPSTKATLFGRLLFNWVFRKAYLVCCLPFCWSRWPGHKASLPRYAGKKGCIILVLPISAKCEAVGHCYQPEATTDPDGAVLAIQISQSKSFSYRGFTVPGKWCLGHWSRYGVFYHFFAIRYHFGTHYFDTHRVTVSIPSENQIMNYDYHNFYF